MKNPSYFQVLSNYRLRGSMWRFRVDCRWPWFYRWILQHNVWKVSSMTPKYIEIWFEYFHFMIKSSIFTAIKPTWILMDLELLLLRLTKAHLVSISKLKCLNFIKAWTCIPDFCGWHFKRKVIWYVTKLRISEILCNIYFFSSSCLCPVWQSQFCTSNKI